LEAIRVAKAIFIAPSNPIGSIGPILAVPEIRSAIEAAAAPCIAVSPIVGGRSLQPPAGEMLSGLGYEVSAAGVARRYADLIDTLIVDEVDSRDVDSVQALGPKAIVANTVMRDAACRHELGTVALLAAGMLTA
jgi:LPPG:FO 2-phospho-L-lactate transferase